MVEPDTIRLLRECDAGIKMGVSAIEDVVDRVADKRFRRSLTDCAAEHDKLKAEIQALLASSSYPTPRRTSNGFDYNRAAMLLAVLEKRGQLKVSQCDAYLNIIGGLTLDEPAADLAAIGEVGLTGELRNVNNLSQRLSEVRRLGFTECIIPKQHGNRLGRPDGLKLTEVQNVGEALRVLARS